MALSGISGSDPITNTQGAAEAAGRGDAAKKSTLDKDAFLKLLVAQISNQDPLKPMEGTEFVSQLSQFALVEQAIAQSAKLDLVGVQLGGIANGDATSLVGKTITVRGKGIAFDGATATGSSVTLEGPAKTVTARIRDAEGRTIRTIELGPKPQGAVSVVWDGKDDTGQPMPAGSYSVDVTASGNDGQSIPVRQDVTGRVVRVSFEKGYPELTLDSGVTCPISDLVAVSGEPTALVK
jgi:flagellar basal-body rod modification protein FlgD